MNDHFSKQAADYAKYRPLYPGSLFQFLSGLVLDHAKAWDCATGSGQAARMLAGYFQEVIATDLSQAQIEHAQAHPGVTYRVATGEKSGIENSSVDLTTVAQAFHWLDFDRFYAELRRVSVPKGVIALWCYGLHEISPEVDAVARRYYAEIIDSYWPSEVKWVRQEYRTIPFPFEEIAAPDFYMEQDWSLENVVGNFFSWSSTQRYLSAHGKNPIEIILPDLQKAWGEPSLRKKARWKIHLRVGRL
ncbi:MAG: class I SAM-dependent methyltransferase [bacterium]